MTDYVLTVTRKMVHPVLVFLVILFILLFFAAPASAILYGDIDNNGQVNVNDVVLLMRYVLGLEQLNSLQMIAADVNNDNDINVNDVTLLMRMTLGLIDEFDRLPGSEFSPVKSFRAESVDLPFEDRKLVMVKLIVPDPENYRVEVAGVRLNRVSELGDALNLEDVDFFGYIDEDDAVIEKVKVIHR